MTITDMSWMFNNANIFNQPIGHWDVSNVKDMQGMFMYARKFNQPIGEWDIASVRILADMFHNAFEFNQPIGEWNTSTVEYMKYMFADARAFNQPIENWNFSKVISTYGMFQNAQSFNQPIGKWDVSNVIIMGDLNEWNTGGMFEGATSFNQDLSQWNISKVTNMTDMFKDSNLSTQNYDAILNTWSQLDLQRDVPFGAGTIKYSSDAEASRQSMIDDYNWTISDGGLDMTDAEAVQLAKADLTLGDTTSVTTNLTLAPTGLYETIITYSSNNTDVLSSTGVIISRPNFGDGDATVILTATISKNGVSDTKSFTVVVKQKEGGVDSL